MMLSNSNKVSPIGAIIILFTACTISISAQTDANRLIVKPEASETIEATVKKKLVPPAGATTLVTEEVAEVNTRSEMADSTLAAGEPAERRAATTKSPANPQAASSDEWQFQVTPYGWMATSHGTGGVGNRTVGVDIGWGDIFATINFFAMGSFEARKGRFISLTDVFYASISDDKATPGPLFSTVDAGFKQFFFDQEVGYRLYDNPDNGASVDVLGGARVWRVKTDFEFGAGILPAARIEGSRSWVDAVGGLRGRAPISEKMFLTGKFDLGGGGSQFTWQVFGGAGYSLNENIALIVGYRVLDVDYNKNNFVYDLNQRGPIVGVAFKF